MKLQHRTEVNAQPDDVWAFLQDTPAVVECMPGAELVDDLGDDHYEGVLHVAFGPLKMNYVGRALVVERDPGAHRIVLDAAGRDKRGSGSVQAHVRLQVAPAESGTRIDVVSDLDLTGRVASLGRGIRDVSNQMFIRFADELGNRIEHPALGGQVAATQDRNADVPAATATMTSSRTHRSRPADAGTEIKVLPLIWAVTRQRIADLLDRLSARVRPN